MLEGSEFPTAKLRGINSNHNHTTFIRIFGYISVRAEMDVSFDCMTGFENIVYFFLGGGGNTAITASDKRRTTLLVKNR
jgi:hypothetical protein